MVALDCCKWVEFRFWLDVFVAALQNGANKESEHATRDGGGIHSNNYASDWKSNVRALFQPCDVTAAHVWFNRARSCLHVLALSDVAHYFAWITNFCNFAASFRKNTNDE